MAAAVISAAGLIEHALAEQHQPQREQRIGQRRHQRQHERHEHQPRLVTIAELAQPPHRRQRRRQRLDGATPTADRLRRGRHRPLLLRLLRHESFRLQIEHRAVAAAGAISSSCVPSSTTRPCSRTQIRSACRTVEKRWEMRIVVQCRVAVSRRSKISDSPRTSSCAVGSSRITTPAPMLHGAQGTGQRHTLPLAAGEISAAAVAASEHGVEARRELTRLRRRAPRAIVGIGRPGRRHVVSQWQLEPQVILEHGRDPRSPRREIELRGRRRRRFRSRPTAGRTDRHSSLASVVLPAPFWPTIASDDPAGTVKSK